MKFYTLTALCTIACAAIAAAQVPSLINYQGRLTDANGDPVTGSKNFAISIYDAANGGNLLYTETIGAVTLDDNGVYSFQFGGSGTSNMLVTETIGATVGSTLTYTKSLSKTPVIANSIAVSDGTNSWSQSVGNPGATATATANTIAGFVIGATVTSSGSGYSSAPAVTITGNGTGATATATVSNGQVTGLTITSAGIGYTGPTTISIAPPVIPFRVDFNQSTITATYSSAPAAGRTITATYRYGSNNITGAFSNGAEHWMALSVDGITQETRQRVLAVPFAVNALNSVSAASANHATTATTATTVVNGSITAEKLSSTAVTNSLGNSGSIIVAKEARNDLITQGFTEVGLTDVSSVMYGKSNESRWSDTAVWTGTELIRFGGYYSTYTSGCSTVSTISNTGARYNPATDTWVGIANAPSGRRQHTAVWTGAEMIVWGGISDTGSYEENAGARYNPSTNTWTSISTTNAPDARGEHTAVWTGTEMIVFGGSIYDPTTYPYEQFRGDGGRYNPKTDTWNTISTNNAPSARKGHAAVWTGTEMIVWGGIDIESSYYRYRNDGARYNPSTDTWTAISTINAPDARAGHSAVWTGTKMIISGGYSLMYGSGVGIGAYYDPNTDTWTTMNAANAVMGKGVWTGSEFLAWDASGFGGTYNLATDSWTRILFNSTRYDNISGESLTWLEDRLMIYNAGNITFVRPAYLHLYAKP
jgi:N-acetylneuraminic acid mutarotase